MANRELTIDPEFRDLLGPLRDDERSRLRESLIADGPSEPIIVWANHDNTIVDGHNRYDICVEEGIDFKVKALTFQDRHEVLRWIRDRQLGRRNLTEAKRTYLIGLDYLDAKQPVGKPVDSNLATVAKLAPRQEIAEKHDVSERTVHNSAKFAEAVDAAPAAVKALVLNEEVTASTKALQDLAAMPKPAQRKAVEAIKSGKAKSVKAAVGAFSIVDAEVGTKPGKNGTSPRVLDKLKGPVPKSLEPIFARHGDWERAMQHISNAKKVITEFGDDLAAGYLDRDEFNRLLDQARANLAFAMPHTECCKCRRKPVKACVHCKGYGWITKKQYTGCATDEDKSWLEART